MNQLGTFVLKVAVAMAVMRLAEAAAEWLEDPGTDTEADEGTERLRLWPSVERRRRAHRAAGGPWCAWAGGWGPAGLWGQPGRQCGAMAASQVQAGAGQAHAYACGRRQGPTLRGRVGSSHCGCRQDGASHR